MSRLSSDRFAKAVKSYRDLSAMIKTYSYEEILEKVSDTVGIEADQLEKFPMGGYSKGRTSGAYEFVLKDLLRNIHYYDQLFEKLADDISKEVFTSLMQYRVIPDLSFIKQAFDGENNQYFDKDIMQCSAGEVFVDCGGFTGDTTEEYIRQYKQYKKIYVYEPSRDNIMICRKNLSKYAGIEIRNCGVGEKSALMPIVDSGSSSSFVGVEQGTNFMKVISLDEDIKEPVTFIKMDIEGFEIPAITGAKNHIKNDSPKLAICTYHIVSDMWEIFKLIESINPNYKFYVRHYMEFQNWETVLYAIPKEKEVIRTWRQTENRKTVKKITAMAPYERGWSNVELIKDCGLIPYLLYKNYGYEVTMVGAESDNYTFLEQYIQGVHMEFLHNGKEEEKIRYIEKEALNIDCLILRGCYSSNFNVAAAYKQRNPAGRIYVGLDANSSWMDRINWEDKRFAAFMDCCDVIGTSGRALQQYLNLKWPWKIENIVNGYYDFSGRNIVPIYEEKENIILTVGRIGTEQKANHILLEAFAEIAGELPEWRLRLVGNIEESFREYIAAYFARFPQLRGRVEFIGAIHDRRVLYDEYLKAKIFALTSVIEGTPNVISEALNAGCVTAVTKIDVYEDAIDYGECGMAAAIDDIPGFAGILSELCRKKNLKEMSENAYRHGSTYFNMEKIVAKLNIMLFGGL